MADSMCGPSNAGKGLVNHFDRNRSIQQDRFVNSSPSHNSASFRSSPHLTTGSDAAFNAFQSQTSPSSSFPAPQIPGVPLNLQPSRLPSQPTAMAAPSSWVRDFQNMRLSNGSPHQMAPGSMTQQGDGAMNAAHMGPAASGGPIQQNSASQGFEGHSMFTNPYMAPGIMAAYNSGTFLPFQQSVQPAAPVQAVQDNSPIHGQYEQYPQNVAVSQSMDDAALDAAFAAYDQDFENEMSQWMTAHGPQDSFDMAEVESNMEAIADEQDVSRVREAHQEQTGNTRSPVPNDDGLTTEFRQAAMDILDTVGQNQGEKFKNSSFLELMRRICAEEVILQGEDLVDVKNGTILGGDGPNDAGTQETQKGETTIQQPHAENNGKGKDVDQA